MRHNKKRNAAIIYEQLVRFISKSLVDGKTEQAKEAMAIVQEHFKPGTHLHKEFRLFNALVRTTVQSENVAFRILDEAKRAAKEHDSSALDKEKGLLIRSINRRLNHSNFFEQRIPDYRSLATVQTLLNDWRTGGLEDISRIAEYETKVAKMLTEQKVIPSLELNKNVSNLSVNLMKKKVSEKMSNELTTEQFKLIKLSLMKDKENLIPMLKETKYEALNNVNIFEKKNKNESLAERVDDVKKLIESLSADDISEENVSKFLVLSKLVEELKGEENVK
jgi:hypothetical protein